MVLSGSNDPAEPPITMMSCCCTVLFFPAARFSRQRLEHNRTLGGWLRLRNLRRKAASPTRLRVSGSVPEPLQLEYIAMLMNRVSVFVDLAGGEFAGFAAHGTGCGFRSEKVVQLVHQNAPSLSIRFAGQVACDIAPRAWRVLGVRHYKENISVRGRGAQAPRCANSRI